MCAPFPLIGFTNERQRVITSLTRRTPLLILGPGGAGKTALISAALKELAWADETVHITYSSSLHHVLVDLARSLLGIEHDTFRKIAKPSGDLERWLAQQTSIHLKGLLWSALEADPRAIILEDIVSAGFPAYRFFQRLYFVKGMVLLAAARDAMALGALARLFWDPRNTLHLRPLSDLEANRVFDLAVERFAIGNLDIEEFRGKVLDAARGNPGQLIEMCRLASNPMYVSGTHIKFAPLRIDVLMKFI